jgi:hypothetical protein
MKNAILTSAVIVLLTAAAEAGGADIHSIHAKDASCDSCHARASGKDEVFRDGWKRMWHPTCAECHDGFSKDMDEPKGGFASNPKEFKARDTRFAHARHLPLGKKCEDCHEAQASGMALKIKMSGCVDCHSKSKVKKASCGSCHVSARETAGPWKGAGTGATLKGPEAGLQTLVPKDAVLSSRHDPSWGKSHGRAASANTATCRACHDERKCASCHMGKERKLAYHTGDWVTAHGIASKKHTPECSACHTSQGFCLGCHQRAGAAPSVEAGGKNWKPHPSGWTWSGSAGGRHMTEARRDISSCAACHKESDCIKCHASRSKSGSGFSPHPQGFASRCAELLGRSENACTKCHTKADLKALCQGTKSSPLKNGR